MIIRPLKRELLIYIKKEYKGALRRASVEGDSGKYLMSILFVRSLFFADPPELFKGLYCNDFIGLDIPGFPLQLA